MTLQIRKLEPEDHAEWSYLWRAYLKFYETELPAEVFETTFGRLMSDSPHEFQGLVAVKDGKLVGLVHYLFHRHGWKIEDVCYLQDLYVSDAARGTGAGRALIEAVYKAADRKGAPGVYWLTQDHNAIARRLYDRIATLTPFVKYNR